MTLRTTTLGLSLIKAFEACKLTAYICPAGKWTIGWGHTSEAGGPVVRPGMKITQRDADQIFRDDVDNFEDAVELLLGSTEVSENEFDALVSFAFNAGIPALKSSTLLKKVKLKSNDDIIDAEFQKWNKATVEGKKVIMPGLSRRRRAEAALWRNDLASVEMYAQMKFPPMPQNVAPPEPPKPITKSTTANAAVVAGGAGVLGGIRETVDQIKEITAPVTQTTQAVQDVTGQVSNTAAQGHASLTNVQNTVDTVQQVASQVPPAQWTSLLPGILIMVLIVTAAAYIWTTRKRQLKEEGV